MLLLAGAASLLAFNFMPGDPVPLMRRTQYKEQRSQWLEVPHRVSPRFGVAKTVLIDGVPTDWDGHSEYKIAFALDGMHFTTPWITVAEERKGAAQRFLWRLTLRLSGRGDMIMAARWEPAYSYDEPPAQVELAMEWEQDLEEDPESALNLLFGLSALMLILLLVVVTRESEAFEAIWNGENGEPEEVKDGAYPPPAARRRRHVHGRGVPAVDEHPRSRRIHHSGGDVNTTTASGSSSHTPTRRPVGGNHVSSSKAE